MLGGTTLTELRRCLLLAEQEREVRSYTLYWREPKQKNVSYRYWFTAVICRWDAGQKTIPWYYFLILLPTAPCAIERLDRHRERFVLCARAPIACLTHKKAIAAVRGAIAAAGCFSARRFRAPELTAKTKAGVFHGGREMASERLFVTPRCFCFFNVLLRAEG